MNTIYNNAKTKGYLAEAEEALYESIEERTKRAVKHADTNCRKVRRGQIPFSPKAQEIMRKIRILKIVLQRTMMKGNKNRPKMRKLRRLAKKYKYNGSLSSTSKENAVEALVHAKREYSEFKPHANELRGNYLFVIASEKAATDPKGRNIEWHHNKLLGEEKIKAHFKHIRKYEGKSSRKGVENIAVQRDDGSMYTVYNREEVATHIIKANIEKRQQARNTPCRAEPLSTLLGEQMEYNKWEDILKGNINLPTEGIEEGTRLWYEMMTTPNQETFAINWTTQEYCDSWKKMDEEKSSIPGIHTAHMKCLDPLTTSAEVLSKLALIPLLTGYAPRSWKIGIDSMIPKKVIGESRPDKLRLILLFDARFNHNNKLIGKKMMEYAEERGLLAREQFGSRKNKSAIEHAINKRLTLDISRQHKLNCVYIANDAKSCYDRILLMVAYV